MSGSVLQFLGYSLDPANAQLRRGTTVIALRPKTLAVLHYLAAHAGRLVTKAELLDAVWPDTAVGEWVLTGCIKELRRALDDDPHQPRAIETAHRHGYRFIAETQVSGVGSQVSGTAHPRLRAIPSTRHPTPALIGRGAELTQLDDCLQRARASERQIVFVVGEPGIGKTSLVDAFIQGLAATPSVLLAHGQCIEQHGAGEPYMPVLEALGRLCSASEAERVVDVMRRRAPAWLLQLPGVLDATEAEALERRWGTTTQARMLREMASLVAALPDLLVLVLEDLHWSDHATIDLLSMLAQRRDAARLLFIGTYRPVDVVVGDHPLKTVHQELRTHGRCRDLWLQPLKMKDVSEYFAARWPGLEANDALTRVVYQRTDGNPLFLVNISDYLVAEGAVVQTDGRWLVRVETPTLTAGVPSGLRQLVAMQIDRLREPERTMLEAGSVIGRTFSAALVAAALEADVVAVEQQLSRLAHTGQFVRAAGVSDWPDATIAGTYELTHDMYQRVLRDRVPPARCRQLHARVAARLESGYRDRTSDIAVELAHHFEMSGAPDRAVPYLEDAAARAVRRGAAREAVDLLNRGLTLLDGLPVTSERTLRKIRLLIALGRALPTLGGFGHPTAEQAYLRARALSEETNDQVQLFQALGPLAAIYVAQARLNDAAEAANAIGRLMDAMPLPAFLFAGNLVLGIVQYHCGRLDMARQHLDRALAIGEVPLPAMSGDLHVHALGHSALTVLHLGLADQARALSAQAVDRAIASGRPFDRQIVLQVNCFLYAMLHDVARLEQLAEEAIALATEHDMAPLRAIGTVSRGRAMVWCGHHEDGTSTMADGIEAYRSSGQRLALPSLLSWLIEAHLDNGNPAAAEPLLAEASTIVSATGDLRSVAELHRLQGQFHLQHHDQTAAVQSFRRAIAVARDQGARWWELRALTSLARVRGHDAGTAIDELATVVASFTEGRDTIALQQAERTLKEGAI